MSSRSDIPRITVPGQRVPLVPRSAANVRALRRHLIQSLRALIAARRRDRLIQPRAAEPQGTAARLARAACAHCAGACCMAGGTHAFIDERTLARVCAENPGLTPRRLIALYTTAVAPVVVRGSCVFHGPDGCTLARPLRAELCNAYQCNPLSDLLSLGLRPGAAVDLLTHAGDRRRVRA